MNYGPYMGFPYYSIPKSSAGLFSRLFSNFNFSSILNNTQKTLNIVNQVVPVIKQVKPVVNNAKTMFKVMNEFKKNDSNINIEKNMPVNNNSIEETNHAKEINKPTFFM